MDLCHLEKNNFLYHWTQAEMAKIAVSDLDLGSQSRGQNRIEWREILQSCSLQSPALVVLCLCTYTEEERENRPYLTVLQVKKYVLDLSAAFTIYKLSGEGRLLFNTSVLGGRGLLYERGLEALVRRCCSAHLGLASAQPGEHGVPSSIQNRRTFVPGKRGGLYIE